MTNEEAQKQDSESYKVPWKQNGNQINMQIHKHENEINDSNETERRQHDPYGTALAKAQVMLLDKESIDIWYL